MSRRSIAAAATTLVLALSLALPAPAAEPPAASSAAAPTSAEALARLKELAGRWQASSPQVPGGLVVSWKVTAGGSAVMETMFEGTPHEMVSMYFLDGDELRMTHYCAAGNQPRMRYDARRSSGDELAFVFDGGTSFNPRKDMHIHEGRIHLGGEAVKEHWAAWMDGKQSDVKEFTLDAKL